MTPPEPPSVTLKPCPFCGGVAQLASGGPGLHYVRCEGCTASTDDGSRKRAVRLWNTRTAAEAASRAEIDELVGALGTAADTINYTIGRIQAWGYGTSELESVLADARALLAKHQAGGERQTAIHKIVTWPRPTAP